MTDTRTPETLAAIFLKFGRTETHGSSPLYSLLAEGAASEPDLTGIASTALAGQHEPLMLFAAVHYLLLTGVEHPLAEYYASCTSVPRSPDKEALTRFLAFCRLNRKELIGIISARRAQTNEVNRSAILMPAFAHLAGRVEGRPVNLIELGTSAGLNLNWDHYGYVYGSRPRSAPLRDPGPELGLDLETELHGPGIPPLDSVSTLKIVNRSGIDLHPIDLSVSANTIWLQALVWPEHLDRLKRLERAIRIARRFPPPILAGDAGSDLPAMIQGTPSEWVSVVFHSFVVYQLSEDQRAHLFRTLREMSAGKMVYRISFEWLGTETPLLEVDSFEDGYHAHTVLAAADPHGRWLEWLHQET
jgi:hypothetical protein